MIYYLDTSALVKIYPREAGIEFDKHRSQLKVGNGHHR